MSIYLVLEGLKTYEDLSKTIQESGDKVGFAVTYRGNSVKVQGKRLPVISICYLTKFERYSLPRLVGLAYSRC